MSDLTQATLNLQAAPIQTNRPAALTSSAAGSSFAPVSAGPNATSMSEVSCKPGVGAAEAGLEPEAAGFAFHFALQPKDELPAASGDGADLTEVISQVMGSRDAQEAQQQVRGRKPRRNPASEGAIPELVYELGQEFRELQGLMGQLGQDMSGAATLMEQITLKSGELTSLLLQAATQAQALSQRSGQVLMQLKARK